MTLNLPTINLTTPMPNKKPLNIIHPPKSPIPQKVPTSRKESTHSRKPRQQTKSRSAAQLLNQEPDVNLMQQPSHRHPQKYKKSPNPNKTARKLLKTNKGGRQATSHITQPTGQDSLRVPPSRCRFRGISPPWPEQKPAETP